MPKLSFKDQVILAWKYHIKDSLLNMLRAGLVLTFFGLLVLAGIKILTKFI